MHAFLPRRAAAFATRVFLALGGVAHVRSISSKLFLFATKPSWRELSSVPTIVHGATPRLLSVPMFEKVVRRAKKIFHKNSSAKILAPPLPSML